MKISLQQAGKRFNRDWIFRNCSIELIPGQRYAITGPNGSGKSTLLQVIAGATMHSEGRIIYTDSESKPVPDPYRRLAIAAPYLELIEEMTATELLQFHSAFKSLSAVIPTILAAVQLQKASDKQIRYFSSGMKQRLKLAQAFFSDVPVLLLDEPTTNLDAEGVGIYNQLIQQHSQNRTIVVSSNVPAEYNFCDEIISIQSLKK